MKSMAVVLLKVCETVYRFDCFSYHFRIICDEVFLQKCLTVFAKNLHHKFSSSTAQKIKFSIKDFFSKCDQIHRNLRICFHLLKKSLMENFIVQCIDGIIIYTLFKKMECLTGAWATVHEIWRKVLTHLTYNKILQFQTLISSKY